MRHKQYRYQLGVTTAHRVSLMKNMSAELIDHGKIKSTNNKCKALRSYVEKLITIAKEDTIANRRLVNSRLEDKNAVKKLFSEVAPRFKNRQGGYTRILKIADARLGDGAKMSYIAFVE